MIYVAFLLGTGLGAAVVFWLRRTQSKGRRRIPKEWPLALRPLVNSREKQVWIWLAKVMFDQQILIKLPVTRFTAPAAHSDAAHWYQLLNGVYCTFTICKADGKVMGCLDVPGKNALPRSTRMLKHSLLTQCGLPYWVVRSSSLPTVAEIRAEFLGESPTAQSMREREQEERAIIAAQANLRSAINRQRNIRHSDFSPMSNWPSSTTGDTRASDLSSQWQDNSFLVPLDSRKGDLL